MENTTLKAENLKPIILKAGVPLAVSLAGLIYAWIITKKSLKKVSSFSENYSHAPEINSHDGTRHEENFDNFSSMEDEEEKEEEEEEEEHDTSIDSSVVSESFDLEQEITCLRSKIEGMKMRELALTLQFDRYCEMKEKESMLMEIKNMLLLETSRVEFFDREISFIETETMRLESFVVQYLKIIEKVEFWKSENRLLQNKVQKLLKKSKSQSLLIKEQTLMIREGEEEILRNHDELQKRASVIHKLEDEIKELKRVLVIFQDEKNDLMKKVEKSEEYACKELELHKKPLKYYLQIDSKDVMKEDFNKILNELEKVKKEHEIEVEELNHLREINVCLRQELMKHELHCSFLDHQNVSCIVSNFHGDPSCSKKKKLINKLKKWVDGSEKVRVKPEAKSSNEIKCFGLHSAPTTPRFCSSA